MLKAALKKLKESSDKRVYAGFNDATGKVTYWTPKDIGKAMADFEKSVTPEQLKEIKSVSEAYQKEAKKMMDILVEGNLISKPDRIAIEAANDYYAPFMIEKYLRKEGVRVGKDIKSGKVLHSITGLDNDFVVGDMSQVFREKLISTTLSADQNNAKLAFVDAMKRDLPEVVDDKILGKVNIGGEGVFLQKVDVGIDPKSLSEGWATFTVMRKGKLERYAVDKRVSDAIKSFGEERHAAIEALALLARPFKIGVTKWSIRFQQINALWADALTNAFTAETGLKANPADWAKFVFWDNPKAFLTALSGNSKWARQLLGKMAGKNFEKSYREMMSEGLVGGTTMRSAFDPSNLAFGGKLPRFSGKLQGSLGSKTLGLVDKGINKLDILSDSIEEMGKIVGVNRKLRMEGVNNLKELYAKNPELKN